MHYVKLKMVITACRTSHRPSTPQRDRRRQEIHAEHVHVVAVDDVQPDIVALDRRRSTALRARPRDTRMMPLPVRTTWSRAVADVDAGRARASARSIVVIVAPLSTRNLTGTPLIRAFDPEMAVDRHRDADFAAGD